MPVVSDGDEPQPQVVECQGPPERGHDLARVRSAPSEQDEVGPLARTAQGCEALSRHEHGGWRELVRRQIETPEVVVVRNARDNETPRPARRARPGDRQLESETAILLHAQDQLVSRAQREQGRQVVG